MQSMEREKGRTMEELLEVLGEVNSDIDFTEDGLVSDGVLDSFTILQIIDALENHYDIKIKAKDVIPENFDSAEAMLDMIEELM